MWWAKARLLAPMWFGTRSGFWAKHLRYSDLLDDGGNEKAEIRPYERLARLWHEFNVRQTPNYAPFVAKIARSRRLQLRSVLDLACGAGTITETLATIAPEVIGLDKSEEMLSEARARCASLAGVRFTQGDFCDFDLGRQFEAVVCGSDSLNYVRDADDLRKVFRCVAAHLASGGVFVFDTLTERAMRMLSGCYYHGNINGERFAIACSYDPVARKENARVHFASSVEIHSRIPIDPKDVEVAARTEGLHVRDYFSFASIPGRWFTGLRCFFVVTKSAAGEPV